MAVDLQRVAKAAVDAALQQPTAKADVKKPRLRLSGGRAFLVGAGLATAVRLIAGPKGREMLESLERRIEESDWYREYEEPGDATTAVPPLLLDLVRVTSRAPAKSS